MVMGSTRLEGTIIRLLTEKDDVLKNTVFLIAEIETAAGGKHIVKGSTSRHGAIGDYLVGNFYSQANERYGDQMISKGNVELHLPRRADTILKRINQIAKKADIKMTPTMSAAIRELEPTTFWKQIHTAPVVLDGINRQRWSALLKAIIANTGETEVHSSLDMEEYIKGLGLPWTERRIRSLTGYEEDCENPENEPMAVQYLKDEPLAIIGVKGIKASEIEAYLRALERLGTIDAATVKIGGLLKRCRNAESDNSSCIPVVESDIQPLRAHADFRKYLTEYSGYLYRREIYEAEKAIATFVSESSALPPLPSLEEEGILTAIQSLPPDDGRLPTGPQVTAVVNMFAHRISTVQGKAGSGKTTTLRTLARYVKAHREEIRGNMLFLAPTGKAVQRMKDSIHDIELTDSDNIMTIHRFVGLAKRHAKWRSDGENKEADTEECVRAPMMIVLDESSMICTQTLAMLFGALGSYDWRPQLVFMGDDCQLSPVGIGTPFVDILRSAQVTTTILETVHRQGAGSSLMTAVNEIRDREDPSVRDDAFNIFRISSENGVRKIQRWIDNHREGVSAIIVPTNDMVDELTPIVRDHVNPASEEVDLYVEYGGTRELLPYRKGDKIMQVKNNYKRSVFNGTMGKIVGVVLQEDNGPSPSGKKNMIPVLHVRFDGRDNDFYYRLSDASKELQHAYVMTTHKAQGSEYDHVLIIQDRYIEGFINRNLTYTASSRGKKSVAIYVKDTRTMDLWKHLPRKPKTNLTEMILAAVEEYT